MDLWSSQQSPLPVRPSFPNRAVASFRVSSPDVTASDPAGKILAGKFTQLTSDIRMPLTHLMEISMIGCAILTSNCKVSSLVSMTYPVSPASSYPSLFSDIQRAASGGPVIIANASKYSWDTLIILLDRDPVHIPLQITKGRARESPSEFHVLTICGAFYDPHNSSSRIHGSNGAKARHNFFPCSSLAGL